MKKAKTQTGLIKENPAAEAKTRKKSGGKKGGSAALSVSKKSTPKAKKTEPKKPRKQGGKGRPYQPHDWATYAPGNKAPRQYSEEEIRGIVKKAAKAANSRLRAIEKKGLEGDVPAYKYAKKHYARDDGKPRFKESTAKLSREELNREFIELRDFMMKKTSTITGYRTYREQTLNKAREMGFTGDDEKLSNLFHLYMTEKNEQMFGSDVIYQAIMTESVKDLQEIGRAFQAEVEADVTRGERLLQLVRRRRGK